MKLCQHLRMVFKYSCNYSLLTANAFLWCSFLSSSSLLWQVVTEFFGFFFNVSWSKTILKITRTHSCLTVCFPVFSRDRAYPQWASINLFRSLWGHILSQFSHSPTKIVTFSKTAVVFPNVKKFNNRTARTITHTSKHDWRYARLTWPIANVEVLLPFLFVWGLSSRSRIFHSFGDSS